MIFSKDNFLDAKSFEGRKAKFWSEQGVFKSNVYIGTLERVCYDSFYFIINKSTQELYKKRVDLCRYKRDSATCFEFIETLEEKDKNGNFLLEF